MKIYLCKSNQSDPAMLEFVRTALQDKYDIFEYQGGKYTSDDMLQCDAMIVVPPVEPFTETKGPLHIVYVGSGQLSQVDEWLEKQDPLPVYVFENQTSGLFKIIAIQLDHYEAAVKNPSRNFGAVVTKKGVPQPLNTLF